MALSNPIFLIQGGRGGELIYKAGTPATANLQLDVVQVVSVRRVLQTRPTFKPEGKQALGVRPDVGVYEVGIGDDMITVVLDTTSTPILWV